ncbi:MAG: terpene cyclase/mutase family protein [Planctomycetaceae bacterium]|nr:terpene cyclase/mutase family protein [Planctomycetaceae bacterium]
MSTVTPSVASGAAPQPRKTTARVVSLPLSTLPRLERKTDWRVSLTKFGISFGLHATALIICGLFTFGTAGMEKVISTITVFDEPEPEPIIERSPNAPVTNQMESTPITSTIENIASSIVSDSTAGMTLDINDLDPSVAVGSNDAISLGNIAGIKIGDVTSGRTQAGKSALVRQFGGNSSSEAAVASGCKWLANHQLPDGSWSFDHRECKDCDGKCEHPGDMKECRIAATGLALLAYLGGGHTHQKGDYQKQVRMGVDALVKMGVRTPEGFDLRGEMASNHAHAAFYSHGIATIALSEIVALSKDAKYRPVALEAVKFIVAAQDPKGGGWRYTPRSPGDTSVVGWQIMALKSAQNAKLKFPSVTFKGADLFLDSVQSQEGSLYAYTDPKQPSPTTTAVGLLSRMYLGWDRKQEGLQKGIEFLDKTMPQPNNMYYNYYATQVMHHWGGEEWTRWNNVMRDRLTTTQHPLSRGHSAGSWDPADPHGSSGGRHYMTCLSVMTLEVYYRHLPIYQRENIKVEF